MTINDFASTRSSSQDTAARRVTVWDPLVRLFLWGLVCAFATAWLTAEDIQPVHQLAGYAVAGLVGFRVLWGLVGSRYARVTQLDSLLHQEDGDWQGAALLGPQPGWRGDGCSDPGNVIRDGPDGLASLSAGRRRRAGADRHARLRGKRCQRG